jgi:hypothetical protein
MLKLELEAPEPRNLFILTANHVSSESRIKTIFDMQGLMFYHPKIHPRKYIVQKS